MNSPFRLENYNIVTESNLSKNDNFFEMKNQIVSLEKNNNTLQNENDRLLNINHSLEKERIEMNTINDLKEKTIKEQTILLDNLKKKNENLENRITDLEKINSDLNYAVIELNQKNKTLIENQNILLSSTKEKEITNKLINISQQLDNISISKSRLEHDNKFLLNKINHLQSQHENEINMLKTIQNSEITKKNNIISNLQNGLSQLKLNSSNDIINNSNLSFQSNIHSQCLMNGFLNFEKKTKMIKEDNIKLYSIVSDLENKLKVYEDNIERKNKYIKELQDSLRIVEEELKLKKEENDNIYKENHFQIEKFSQERDELIKQNNNLKNAYEHCNIGIKDINELFNQKTKSFQTLISNYNNKLKELQFEIDQLNQKNEILTLENEKLKRSNLRYERRENILKNPIQKRDLSFNGSGKNILNSPILNSNRNNTNEININNTFSGNVPNDYNINSYNSNISKVINKTVNTSENQNYVNFEDPYVLSQQKSLEEFKNILQKVDENLLENSSFLMKVKDDIN